MPHTSVLAVATRVALIWTSLQASGACVTGLALILGGAERFLAPSFIVAATLMPWWLWGALFLTTGLLMLSAALGRQPCVLWASVLPAVMYAVFAGSIAYSATDHAQVPLTGPAVYAGLMVLTTASGCVGRWVFNLRAST